MAENCFLAAGIIAFIGLMFWLSDKYVDSKIKQAEAEIGLSKEASGE